MSRWLKKLAAVGVVLVLLAALDVAVTVIRADFAYFRAEKAFAQFLATQSEPSLHQLAKARRAIDKALRLWPDNPHHLGLSARVMVWEGYLAARTENAPEVEIQYYLQAIALLRRALELSPAHAYTWALLAEYKIHIGQRDEEWHRAREKALELAGSDIALVERMMKL